MPKGVRKNPVIKEVKKEGWQKSTASEGVRVLVKYQHGVDFGFCEGGTWRFWVGSPTMRALIGGAPMPDVKGWMEVPE